MDQEVQGIASGRELVVKRSRWKQDERCGLRGAGGTCWAGGCLAHGVALGTGLGQIQCSSHVIHILQKISTDLIDGTVGHDPSSHVVEPMNIRGIFAQPKTISLLLRLEAV